jgi:hypothetical protein
MLTMLQAHGLDAGPTQRPLLAGGMAGLIAAAPAWAILLPFGTPDSLGAIGISHPVAILGFTISMAIGGLLYGALFRRAANDVIGGWLLGLSFGFVLWMLGPVPLLQWLPTEPTLRGYPAAGLLLGCLGWGLALGTTFPIIHREVCMRLEDPGAKAGPAGPLAAVPRRTPGLGAR